MANKTFNTRVKNKRDTAANWEAVATTFQPLDGELIIVDTAAGKTRFKVGRYDTAKGRLLYYNEIPFTDEYLYNDLNESQGKIYDKLKGIDDKSIIESTLEPSDGNGKVCVYHIGLWQFPKTGLYKIHLTQHGTTSDLFKVFARKTKDDGTLPEDFTQDNLVIQQLAMGDTQVNDLYIQVDYTDNDKLTVYNVRFLTLLQPYNAQVNVYDKTTQKWQFISATYVQSAKSANRLAHQLTLTKGDTTTKFDGSTAQTVSIPTKTSELTNDSNFTTQTDLDNLTNTVVSYNAQENITDEQKAQARTNIGAISSSDIIQSDWNQNDETAKDYIKNRPCYTVVTSETSREILQDSGAFVPLLGLVLGETYNVNYSTNIGTEPSGAGTNYVCKDLHDTVSSAPVGTLYIGDINSDGSSGGYTIYNDHIALNSGFSYMVNPQRWKITGNLNSTVVVPLAEKYYPKETAKVYIKDKDGVNIDNAVLNVQDYTAARPTTLGDYYAVKRDTNSNTLMLNGHFVPFDRDIDYHASNTNFKDLDKELEVGISRVTPENYPKLAFNLRAAKSYCDQIDSVVNIVTLYYKDIKFKTLAFFKKSSGTDACISGLFLYGTTLYQFIFTAGSTGDTVSVALVKLANYTVATRKYVDDAIPVIDTDLSSTSENPVQNKVVKAAVDDLQTSIDSKPSAADAVYTATAESTDGVAYTATVSGIDSLTVGASFIMVPNKASTSKAPTLNVNGLGAKPIRRRLSSLTTSLQQGYSTNWIALNKPFTVVYDGTAWVIEGLTKTDGADVYGAVAQATADAKGNNIADTYATIAMLQSLLPKVTTITLTSNWVGDASPYYQDIALSCVTETSIVDLQPTPEQLNSWQDDGLAFTTLSGNGTVRVYVAGGKPSSAISVQVRVQEVTVI